MVKEIRSQIHCMTFVLGMLLCLSVWQWDFIITAISANLFLNLTIFGTFTFGAFVAYRNVLSLQNECVAYDALREDYEDVLNSDAQDAADASWRYYRCNEDAIVFAKPEILEQPFQIISEEIARTNNLSMSTGVMQNLLDSIDDRLDERRSLIQYVTGILIFLGLIGTFVGLMVTLGSVGDIIGSLDLSGGAGAAAIQGLMEDLKVPLQGMATGFSSSLFGLVTSLALGLMARFANQAGAILKMEFETWIAGVAKVDSEAGSSSTHSSPNMERHLSLMLRVARLALISNSKVASSVDKVTKATDQMLAAQIETNSTTRAFADSLCQMTKSQVLTNKALTDISNTLETREELDGIIDELRSDTAKQRAAHTEINASIHNLAQRQSELQREASEYHQNLMMRDEMKWLMSDAQSALRDEFGQLNLTVENLGTFLNEINQNLDNNTSDLKTSQNMMIEESRELRNRISHAITQSKVDIQEADNLELKQSDQSIAGIRRRLFNSFPSEKETSTAEDEVPKKPRWTLNPFKRSA